MFQYQPWDIRFSEYKLLFNTVWRSNCVPDFRSTSTWCSNMRVIWLQKRRCHLYLEKNSLLTLMTLGLILSLTLSVLSLSVFALPLFLPSCHAHFSSFLLSLLSTFAFFPSRLPVATDVLCVCVCLLQGVCVSTGADGYSALSWTPYLWINTPHSQTLIHVIRFSCSLPDWFSILP